jgi:ribosomal protein S18 acetylase RimI-like enzyme
MMNTPPDKRRQVGLIGDLLERAARAAPAAIEDRSTGWWFRHIDHGPWWSGAVLAHGSSDGLAQRIDAAERFYAERDAVARFQICTDCPAGLDQCLAERGYRRQAPVSLLTAVAAVPTVTRIPPLTAVAATPAEAQALPRMAVRADTSLRPDWVAVLRATNSPESDAHHETRLLGRVDRPYTYLTVFADGEPVGIGRAVADDGWTGVFNLATARRARRRGIARLILVEITRWADAHLAPRLYLQVEQSNDAARRLYDAAGFTQLAQYHYRVRPTL